MSQSDAHLLIVDDDERIRALLGRFLRKNGFLVTLARDAAHQLGHPGGALDVGDRRLVVTGRADAVDDLAEAAQRHGRLAEAGQHPLDVAHEDAARPDDEDAPALVATTVGVEQEGGAVQCHDGLAGAGAA